MAEKIQNKLEQYCKGSEGNINSKGFLVNKDSEQKINCAIGKKKKSIWRNPIWRKPPLKYIFVGKIQSKLLQWTLGPLESLNCSNNTKKSQNTQPANIGPPPTSPKDPN